MLANICPSKVSLATMLRGKYFTHPYGLFSSFSVAFFCISAIFLTLSGCLFANLSVTTTAQHGWFSNISWDVSTTVILFCFSAIDIYGSYVNIASILPVFNASFMDATFILGLVISDIVMSCFFKSYCSNMYCIEDWPGVAIDFPFKSSIDVTSGSLVTNPLPSSWAPATIFIGTSFDMDDNTGVTPTYPTSTVPLVIALIKSPPLLYSCSSTFNPASLYIPEAFATNNAASWSEGKYPIDTVSSSE